MKMNTARIKTIEEYIGQFEPKVQEMLTALRYTILEAAPNVEEKIAWSMPTYYQDGFLVQFAVHKNHIGFYSSSSAIEYFKDELVDYKTNTKNTIQFPIGETIPLQLVKKIVQFRIREKSK
jgi:uncharacterized protein YdhG (YjbR/CyaY superfamily)